MITDVDGVTVGHWTDEEARTGCTAVLFPEGTVASGEVRGGAPGTREWDLLAPERLVNRIDAFVLSGGSAFGLAAADGVARFCSEQGRGFVTASGPVPIVVGAVLYDLSVGNPAVRPGLEQGYQAAASATTGRFPTGPVGAGTGATVGKWRRPPEPSPGGIGTATVRHRDLVVSALMAVNAYGDVVAEGADPAGVVDLDVLGADRSGAFLRNTTIGVVATNSALDKRGCLLVAQSAQDGLARCLEPVHTSFDGDAVVAAATGLVAAPLEVVRVAAARAVAAAVRAAVPAA